MITGLYDLFAAILVACVLTMLLSPIMIWLAGRINLIDRPGSALHKRHHSATPMTGGLVILFAGGISVILLRIAASNEIVGILAGTMIVIALGLIDDRWTISVPYKLFGQLLGAVVIIYFGVQVHITRVEWLDISLTLIWLVGLTNAMNFVDSMDGLAVGLAGIASAFFMLVTIDSLQPELSVLSATILGLMIGMFLFSAPPARMFLGDSGSQALGILLASIGIAYVPGQAGLPQAATWFTPILVLGVPIFDMALVVLSRLRRGRPIYAASRDHVYHRLTLMGLDSNRAVLVMQLAAILLSLGAFLVLNASPLYANIIFSAISIAGAAGIFYLERVYHQTGEDQE
jgi:UDP-GlcNAc:undecaprenyl-phosphate GlcNAc-1-phosphate transferase